MFSQFLRKIICYEVAVRGILVVFIFLVDDFLSYVLIGQNHFKINIFDYFDFGFINQFLYFNYAISAF